MKPASKQKPGCWTCKRRKIGCDKASPSCNNCRRSGRECQGYGLRLMWPDQGDGRRARISHSTYNGYFIVSDRSNKQFLNTTFDDLHQPYGPSIYDVISRVTAAHTLAIRPAGSSFIYPRLLDNEPSMMQYYESRISRMISTIDTRNGFRSELIPMALASSSLASLALRNAILAVAAFHRAGATAALPFKAKAVRCLSSSLSSEGNSSAAIVNTQLAVSMMLCVYSVFDETEGHWYSHIDGARAMLYHLSTIPGGKLPCHFLYTWLMYHEVLGEFTQPLRPTQQGVSSIDFLTDDDVDKTFIIGSLGCSLELLEAIHCLNKARCVTMAGHGDVTEALVLERKLVKLVQRIDSSDNPGFSNHCKPLQTAELYRVATLLYHHRVYANHINRNEERQIYLEQAFDLLSQMQLCTSPWPLFVVASEANSDDQRLLILGMLDRMDEARKIGNVFVLRDIIQSFWKQQDLAADWDGAGGQPRWAGSWDLLFGEKRAVPWFI